MVDVMEFAAIFSLGHLNMLELILGDCRYHCYHNDRSIYSYLCSHVDNYWATHIGKISWNQFDVLIGWRLWICSDCWNPKSTNAYDTSNNISRKDVTQGFNFILQTIEHVTFGNSSPSSFTSSRYVRISNWSE